MHELSPKASEPGAASILLTALRELDEQGRGSRALFATVRAAVQSRKYPGSVAITAAPEDCIGAFEQLPVAARRAIVKAVTDNDRWSVRGYEFPWHPGLLRALWRFRQWVHRSCAADSIADCMAREFADIACYAMRRGPAYLLHAAYGLALSLQSRVSLRPKFAAVLGASGISPEQFAIAYARDIPQLPRYRAFWHDLNRHNSVGVVLGLDLIPSAQGFWCIESNLNSALRPARSALYQHDPLVDNLLEFVTREGYQRLMVISDDSEGLDTAVANQLEEGARARGLELAIVEAVNVSSSRYYKYYGVPAFACDRTLVARLARYPTSLDKLFGTKQGYARALMFYLRKTQDPELLLPPTSSQPVLTDTPEDERFPNVVYKLPELAWGKGVFLFKAVSEDHARELVAQAVLKARPRGLKDRLSFFATNKKGIYQPYIRSSLLPDRRLYIIRAHVLVCPQGVQFLSAHRVVSRFTVPNTLAPGIVQDPKPYIVNYSMGASYEILPTEEETGVQKAALAVARGFAWAADYGFGRFPSDASGPCLPFEDHPITPYDAI